MLSKSFVAASIFLLALTSSVDAQASAQQGSFIIPGLGVSGTPGSGDVQNPSNAAPCGDIPITAQNLANSNPVQADASGVFKVSVMNFAP
jgi:hypothetical protein